MLSPAMPSPRDWRRTEREMQGGQPAGQQAIHLLRKRLREIARAQSCFHMAYRNAVVESGQGRG
jgi:hypothetical protein